MFNECGGTKWRPSRIDVVLYVGKESDPIGRLQPVQGIGGIVRDSAGVICITHLFQPLFRQNIEGDRGRDGSVHEKVNH